MEDTDMVKRRQPQDKSDSSLDVLDTTFRSASKAFEMLNKLTKQGIENNIDVSLDWLLVSAWSNLDRMKKLQDEMTSRLQEAKKIAGLMS
ncbi:MAG: hypothetical protein HQL06_13740 [Nitrospirae bacterium]|nr:hypothetical protein [Nitrospirota bacterium]